MRPGAVKCCVSDSLSGDCIIGLYIPHANSRVLVTETLWLVRIRHEERVQLTGGAQYVCICASVLVGNGVLQRTQCLCIKSDRNFFAMVI